jgi:hypothetical protein
MKSCSDHVMGEPLQGCPQSECRLTCVRMQRVPWTNCALCPLLAVSCGDTGLGLFTLTVSSPRMDCIVQWQRMHKVHSHLCRDSADIFVLKLRCNKRSAYTERRRKTPLSSKRKPNSETRVCLGKNRNLATDLEETEARMTVPGAI